MRSHLELIPPYSHPQFIILQKHDLFLETPSKEKGTF